MIGNKEKCVSPWYGFLIIMIVCVVIAAAIFFEFKGEKKMKAAQAKALKNSAAQNVAYSAPVDNAGSNGNNFVF